MSSAKHAFYDFLNIQNGVLQSNRELLCFELQATNKSYTSLLRDAQNTLSQMFGKVLDMPVTLEQLLFIFHFNIFFLHVYYDLNIHLKLELQIFLT